VRKSLPSKVQATGSRGAIMEQDIMEASRLLKALDLTSIEDGKI
jgi:hypothetical protein